MSKKWKTVYLPVLLVVILVVAGGVYWYIDYLRYVSTDDAFIEYYTVTTGPKIMGRIIKLNAVEGDEVKKGELLFELDSTDLVSQKEHLKAVIMQTEAKVEEAKAQYALTGEQIKVLEINESKAREDFGRAEKQFKGEVITKEAYDHAVKDLEAARARLQSGKKELDLAAAAQKSAVASVQAARAQVSIVESQLADTRVYAPADGVIAKRWLLPGDIAQAGQSVFSMIETRENWVQVYLEETKLEGIHEGSQSEYTIDAYPDVTFEGKVYFIGSSTESQFSLIPPNNASGNYTKVTQRIPVKISIDRTQDGKAPDQFHLLSGMSAVVKIFRK